MVNNPQILIFEGSNSHLWFLNSMIIVFFISSVFLHFKMPKILLALALAFYVVGVLSKSYSTTPIGIDFDFNTRHGPFFGLILLKTVKM